MSHLVLGGRIEKSPTIFLWNPSPDSRDAEPNLLAQKRISPGCVGYFNANGGFHVLFNILKTRKQNEDLGYTVPHGYQEFDKVQLSAPAYHTAQI